jgi:glycosyltransferase involved in cell wall biosynthesis
MELFYEVIFPIFSFSIVFCLGANFMTVEKKRLLILGTDGLPARYGGFETLVEQLSYTDYFSDGWDVDVYTSMNGRSSSPKKHGAFNIVYSKFQANGLASIMYDAEALRFGIRCNYDAIVCLGVSVGFALAFRKFFNFQGNIIVNVDGVEWRRAKWGFLASHFLRLSEKICVSQADLIIADNDGIVGYLEQEYKSIADKNIKMIPYGGDQFKSIVDANLLSTRVFCLSRIEPENNVDLILHAVADIGIDCTYFGNWNNSDYGVKLYNKFKDKIDLRSPEYDVSKLSKLRSESPYYIHGHSAGGTNPSLVEAMHSGHTIVAYDCDYNRFTTENQAFYFKDVHELRELIQNIKDMSLVSNSMKMKEIAQRRYTWSEISNSYLRCIEE